jgi:hypothetical protein
VEERPPAPSTVGTLPRGDEQPVIAKALPSAARMASGGFRRRCRCSNIPLVGEDPTRGNDPAPDREGAAPSGWVTTRVAARSLGVSPRTVRWHIQHGNLEAKPEGEGVRRNWLVSIDSVQAFRDLRQRQGQLPGDYRGEPRGADSAAAESSGSAIRELADRLVEEVARASEYRVRLQLSEKSQSTLEEQLSKERRQREEAEREREVLRQQLDALRGAREAPKTVEEASDAEPQSAAGVFSRGEARPRSWWRTRIGSIIGGCLVLVFVALMGFVVTTLILRS